MRRTAPPTAPWAPPARWNAATGNSGGFLNWEFDLSAYAGKNIEVSISYIQDFAVSGLGVFLDDASVTTDGVDGRDVVRGRQRRLGRRDRA